MVMEPNEEYNFFFKNSNDLLKERSEDADVCYKRLKNIQTRKTVYLFITKSRGNCLLENLKPNEGKFVLNIDVLFAL
jgi:hypothetical protein